MVYFSLDKTYIAAGESFRLSVTDPDGSPGDTFSYTLSGTDVTVSNFIGESSLSGIITLGVNNTGFKNFTTSTDFPTGDDYMTLTIFSTHIDEDLQLKVYSSYHYETLDTRIDLGDTFDIWRKKTNSFAARLDSIENTTNEVKSQTIVANGENASYGLSFDIGGVNPYSYVVNIDGITQNPFDAYTIDEPSNSITFSEVPPEDSIISIIHQYTLGFIKFKDNQLIVSDSTDNTFTGVGKGLIVGENNTTSQDVSIILGNDNTIVGSGPPYATTDTVYDSFDYPSAGYLKHQTTGGQNWDGGWDGPSGQSWRITGTGKSLFFNQDTELGLVTDGSKHIWCESQVENYRDLDTPISSSATYCTMLVRAYDSRPYDPGHTGTAADVVKFRIEFWTGTDATGNMRMNVGINQGTLFAHSSSAGYAPVGSATSAGAFEDDKTYLLAMKRTGTAVYASLIEADGDPATLNSEPTWQVTDSGLTGVTFESINLFGNNTAPNYYRGIRVDELRIADNWSDAVEGIMYDNLSHSTVIGENHSIGSTTDAIAIGKNNELSGIRSYAMGVGLKDFGDNGALLLGRYNENPTDDTNIVIASGIDDSNRFSAMEFRVRDVNAITNNSGVIMHAVYNSPSYADDSAAATGGVEIGELYRTGSTIKIRMA